jgi:hypothetical protein
MAGASYHENKNFTTEDTKTGEKQKDGFRRLKIRRLHRLHRLRRFWLMLGSHLREKRTCWPAALFFHGGFGVQGRNLRNLCNLRI